MAERRQSHIVSRLANREAISATTPIDRTRTLINVRIGHPQQNEQDRTNLDMQFLNGITVLLVYQLIGEIGVRALQLPVPGPVLGMLLLFLTLLLRGRVAKSLQSSSAALLSHLSLLFVPAGVGMMVHFDRLSDEWLPITATLLLSTVLSLLSTAAIMSGATRLLQKGADKHG